MKIYAFNQTTGEYWKMNVTPEWARRHDNGHLVSIGLDLTEFSQRAWQMAVRRFDPTPVTQEEWNHSGCQSRCKLRGDATCGW